MTNYFHESKDQEELRRILIELIGIVPQHELAKTLKITASALSQNISSGGCLFKRLRMYFLHLVSQRDTEAHALKAVKDLINYMVEPVGLKCIRYNQRTANHASDVEDIAELTKEFSEFLIVFYEAIRDQKVTADEAHKLKAELRDFIGAAESYEESLNCVIADENAKIKRVG